MEEEDVDMDGNASDNDVIGKEEVDLWFSMGMSREEKYEARKPCKMSLIIKLVGCSIGYQFLLRRVQIM